MAEVGKMKVVGFVDESSMYKIQIVCKVQDPETVTRMRLKKKWNIITIDS